MLVKRSMVERNSKFFNIIVKYYSDIGQEVKVPAELG